MNEPTPDGDPVAWRNHVEELEVLALAQLDAHLDAAFDDHQQRRDRFDDEDPVGAIWFGDDDEWIDRHTQ